MNLCHLFDLFNNLNHNRLKGLPLRTQFQKENKQIKHCKGTQLLYTAKFLKFDTFVWDIWGVKI